MSMDQAHTDLMTAFEAAKALWTDFALAVDYPNRQTVDPASQETPYIDLDIQFFSGEQLDLGPVKTVKTEGLVLMMICTKDNDGVQIANKLRQHFADKMQLRRIGIVEVYAATGGRIRERLGWRLSPLILPFWYTRFTQ